MRALGLAIILTVTGQIPAFSFAADRCSGLFSISKSPPPMSALNLQTIADEWVDLDLQMRTTDSSALQAALKSQRDQVLIELQAHQGPAAALELRDLIRQRRPKVELVAKEQTVRAKQSETLKGRPKKLFNLEGVRHVGPFLNDHQFLARTTDAGGGQIGIYDLRHMSLQQVWNSKLVSNSTPIGISAKLDLFYLADRDHFKIYNSKTGSLEKWPFITWGPGTFYSAAQSKDRSTIFVTLYESGEYSSVRIRLAADGSFEKAEWRGGTNINTNLISSPDGNLIVSTAGHSDFRIFEVRNNTVFRPPNLDVQNKLPMKALVSAESQYVHTMQNHLTPNGPRTVETWDLTQQRWQAPVTLTGEAPLLTDAMYRLGDPQILLLYGRTEKYMNAEGNFFLVDLRSGESRMFDFKESPDESVESVFSSQDQRTLYAITTPIDKIRGPLPPKLYEIDLSNLGVSISPLPEAEMYLGEAMTSPDSEVILFPASHRKSVQILK